MSWIIDDNHAEINFKVRHMMISKVRGRFLNFEGVVDFDEDNPEASSVNVTIDASSLTTRNNDRDNHLRSADFLNVEEYPEITFVSKRVEQTAEGHGLIIGDLTIRGTTREEMIEVQYNGQAKSPYGTVSAGFSGSTTIDRTDYGLTWNAALETGGVLVGEKIEIDIELELIKQTEQQAEAVTA